MNEKIIRKIKSVIIIAIGVGCLLYGYSVFNPNFFSTENKYHAIFKHSAGLQKGTPVTINGVGVGQVSDIQIDPKTAQIIVSFSCKNEFRFSKNSRAEIFSSLLGNAGLQIIPALDNADFAQSGDFLEASIQKGLLDNIGAKIDPMTDNLNKVLQSTDGLMNSFLTTFDDKAQQNIKKSLEDLNATIQSFNRVSLAMEKFLQTNTEALNKSVKNVSQITENLSKTTEQLAQIDLASTLKNIRNTTENLNSILANIEQGNGTIGMLLTDKEIYENLKTASSELGLLLEDLRRNPKRYVHISLFGKKHTEYQTPKDVEPSISERKRNATP